MLAQVRRDVEPLDLAGNLDRLARGVEALDQADARTTLDNRLAELPPANAVRRDDPDAGHHDATHTIPHRSTHVADSIGPTPRPRPSPRITPRTSRVVRRVSTVGRSLR